MALSPKELIRLASATTIGTSLAHHVEIKFVNKKNYGKTDGEKVWLSSPKLEPLHKITHTLNHELLHILLEHVERGRKIVPPDKFHWWVWNLAADDAVTRFLKNAYVRVRKNQTFGADMSDHLQDNVNLSTIPDYPRDAPAEAIYRWLLKKKIEFTEIEIDGTKVIKATVETDDGSFSFFFVELPKNPKGLFGKDQSVQRFELGPKFYGFLKGEFQRGWEMCRAGGINFEKALNEYLKTFSSLKGEQLTFLIPNKRALALGYPVLLPSYASKREKVLVAIDTSGSISDMELSVFMSTLYKYAHRLDMDVVFCDVEISDVLKLQGLSLDEVKNRLRGAKFRGGGGTNYQPVFEYYFQHSSKYKLLIYFTDLCYHFPERHPPKILWAVQLNEWTYNMKPPYGKVVWI